MNVERTPKVHDFPSLWLLPNIMKKTMLTDGKDRTVENTSHRRRRPEASEDDDQGPILVAIALLIILGLLIGLFVTSVYGEEGPSQPVSAAAETEQASQTAPAAVETAPASQAAPTPAEAEQASESAPAAPKDADSDPFKDWKPPTTPEIVITPPIGPEQIKQIAEQWGVEIISLSLTAANYMIDFRFKVLDVEKSKIFFDSRVKPYLLVERSHAKLPVPMAAKVGAFRPTNRGKNILPNKKYYMVFGNPDAHVKSGDKVTMVIGDFKAEHMTVR